MSKDQDTTQNTVAKDANKASVSREEHPIEANPPPSEAAQAWGEKIAKVGPVQAHSDAIAEEAGRSTDPKGKK